MLTRLQPAHPARGEPGPGGAHRRGQVVHCQADRPLLRIPGRPADRRRAWISAPSTWSSTAASWGSSRRCRSCSPARWRITSAMPRPDVTDAEMLDAWRARSATANGWRPCPTGLQTEVGERGGRLSMGQRQLVALMRVLVQKPAIFILDEATASIDPFTEWQIQQALNLILHQVHQHPDRAPPVHREGRGPDHRHGDRAHHRRGQPRRAAGAGRALRHAVQHLFPAPKPGVCGADEGDGGGGLGLPQTFLLQENDKRNTSRRVRILPW